MPVFVGPTLYSSAVNQRLSLSLLAAGNDPRLKGAMIALASCLALLGVLLVVVKLWWLEIKLFYRDRFCQSPAGGKVLFRISPVR